jgi:hypothetical protein
MRASRQHRVRMPFRRSIDLSQFVIGKTWGSI